MEANADAILQNSCGYAVLWCRIRFVSFMMKQNA